MNIHQGVSFILDLVLPHGSCPLSMRWIEPGKFRMGNPRGDEYGEPFDVVLTQGFWLGQYLVTQAQWQSVMSPAMSHGNATTVNYPIVQISWEQAIAFCSLLTQQWAHKLPDGYSFSLPTEAQWEYACCAGTQTRYYNGDSEANLDSIAWHKENSGGTLHSVGEKQPNQWGLYDMIGNVMELCFDEISVYPKGVVVDWIGASTLRATPLKQYVGSQGHIIRGSSFNTPGDSELAWCSGSYDPGIVLYDETSPLIGFRLSLRA
jgi:formylglycine-generating enzyme required for sulfatase activity